MVDSITYRAAVLTTVLLFIGSVSPVIADDDVITMPTLISTSGENPWPTVEDLKVAAEKGDPEAAFQYAQLLELGGSDVTPSVSQALKFYEVSAAGGNGNALFRLAKVAHDGQLGQKTDYPKALDYYQKAARADIPEAIYNVGAMLVSGRGVKRDYEEGLGWLILAEEHGADVGGVEQVRRRLRNYPTKIAAGEARYRELLDELFPAIPTIQWKPEDHGMVQTEPAKQPNPSGGSAPRLPGSPPGTPTPTAPIRPQAPSPVTLPPSAKPNIPELPKPTFEFDLTPSLPPKPEKSAE